MKTLKIKEVTSTIKRVIKRKSEPISYQITDFVLDQVWFNVGDSSYTQVEDIVYDQIYSHVRDQVWRKNHGVR